MKVFCVLYIIFFVTGCAAPDYPIYNHQYDIDPFYAK